MTTVSIHQPNFLPWSGYFSKIANSDVFVFLDDVKCSKNSYVNRNRFSTNETWFWLGIPLSKKSYSKTINEVLFEGSCLTKSIKYLKMNHSKKSHEQKIVQEIVDIFSFYSQKDKVSLSDFNIECIKAVCQFLDIDTHIERSSNLRLDREKKKQDLVIEISKNLGATTYLSGRGAADYQKIETFQDHDLALKYTDFLPSRKDYVGDVCTSIVDCFLREKRESIKNRM